MRRHPSLSAIVGFALTLVSAPAVHAASVPIDGRLDAEYGAARSVQVNATDRGDWTPGFDPPPPPYLYAFAPGSELDDAYAFVAGGALHLFFGGNFRSYQGEPLIAPDAIEVFIDCAPGGQNVLRADNPSLGSYVRLDALGGLHFDADFSPDYWFQADVETPFMQPLWVYGSTLPAGAGGAGAFLGRADAAGPGTLSGGSNPDGVLASLDNSNRGGVGAGCGTASGAGVTTGIEFAIPLAALGSPSGPISIGALVAMAGGDARVSNQVLGPVPAGTCALGAANSTNFAGIPGAQYFTLDAPVPARAASWGRLKARYR